MCNEAHRGRVAGVDRMRRHICSRPVPRRPGHPPHPPAALRDAMPAGSAGRRPKDGRGGQDDRRRRKRQRERKRAESGVWEGIEPRGPAAGSVADRRGSKPLVASPLIAILVPWTGLTILELGAREVNRIAEDAP
jgi:hypothetical protein